MGEAVELRADLADFREHHLLVAAALVGLWVHECALQVHVEAPRAEERHTSAKHVREVDHLAGLDQLDGVEHDLRFHEIAGAALVADAPFRRAASAFGAALPTMGSARGKRCSP